MSLSNEEERLRVIGLHESRGDFVTDVDGFVYYWPTDTNGSQAAHHLRWIADELDRRNAPWQAQIDRYFNEQENKQKDEQKMDQ
jgi:hypothetical protein